MRFLSIAVCGLAGIFCRYGIGLYLNQSNASFPYGTFAINVMGSFLIGIVFVLSHEHLYLSENLQVGIIVGFLGGFTTFSTYSLNVFQLGAAQNQLGMWVYALLSPVCGIGAAFLGVWLTRLLVV
jgi:CrcB protein